MRISDVVLLAATLMLVGCDSAAPISSCDNLFFGGQRVGEPRFWDTELMETTFSVQSTFCLHVCYLDDVGHPRTVTWRSSDDRVATVVGVGRIGAIVSAHAPGVATITAEVAGRGVAAGTFTIIAEPTRVARQATCI